MTTEQILTATLETIRRDGWKPDGWGLTPPYNIRRALSCIVNSTYTDGKERDDANREARQAISQALGQPLGLIFYFECQPGRTQQEIEQVLEKAIAGAGG